jgi:hypothetical protein
LSHRICTGLPCRKLGKLIEELAAPWLAQQESRLRDRRGRDQNLSQKPGGVLLVLQQHTELGRGRLLAGLVVC